RSAKASELVLEGVKFWPHDQHAALQHSLDRPVDRVLLSVVLGPQVVHGDAWGAHAPHPLSRPTPTRCALLGNGDIIDEEPVADAAEFETRHILLHRVVDGVVD